MILLFMAFAGHRICIRFRVMPTETFEDSVWATFIPQFRHHRSQPPLYAMYFNWLSHRGNPVLPIASSPCNSARIYGFLLLPGICCGKCSGYRIGCRYRCGTPHRERNADGCIGMLVCIMIRFRWRHYSGCGFWTYELLMFALLFMMD